MTKIAHNAGALRSPVRPRRCAAHSGAGSATSHEAYQEGRVHLRADPRPIDEPGCPERVLDVITGTRNSCPIRLATTRRIDEVGVDHVERRLLVETSGNAEQRRQRQVRVDAVGVVLNRSRDTGKIDSDTALTLLPRDAAESRDGGQRHQGRHPRSRHDDGHVPGDRGRASSTHRPR